MAKKKTNDSNNIFKSSKDLVKLINSETATLYGMDLPNKPNEILPRKENIKEIFEYARIIQNQNNFKKHMAGEIRNYNTNLVIGFNKYIRDGETTAIFELPVKLGTINAEIIEEKASMLGSTYKEISDLFNTELNRTQKMILDHLPSVLENNYGSVSSDYLKEVVICYNLTLEFNKKLPLNKRLNTEPILDNISSYINNTGSVQLELLELASTQAEIREKTIVSLKKAKRQYERILTDVAKFGFDTTKQEQEFNNKFETIYSNYLKTIGKNL